MSLTIRVEYFASFKEKAKKPSEAITLNEPISLNDLYDLLNEKYGFGLEKKFLRIAVNENYEDFDYLLKEEDKIVFIPPIAGG